MPWIRFITFNNTINNIQAENDLRLLNTVFMANHPGKRGDELKKYANKLRNIVCEGSERPQASNIRPGITPGVAAMETDSAKQLRAEREEKIRKWEEKHKNSNPD